MDQIFSAGVQYNDYKGSVAADGQDTSTLSSSLSKLFNLSDHDHIIGITAYANYSGRTSNIDNISVTILVSQNKINDDELITVHQYKKDILITDFFKLFKRFELTLSPNGNFENNKYIVENN